MSEALNPSTIELESWYNLVADLPKPCRGSSIGDWQTGRSRRSRAAVPDVAICKRSQPSVKSRFPSVVRVTGYGVRRRCAGRGCFELLLDNCCAHLLQRRNCSTDGQLQAERMGRSGLLQPPGRRQEDRRRPAPAAGSARRLPGSASGWKPVSWSRSVMTRSRSGRYSMERTRNSSLAEY